MGEKSKYYKHPQFGHVYGLRQATPFGRAAWPSLVKPKDPPPPLPNQPPGTPRYEVTILLKKDDKLVQEFVAKLDKEIKEMVDLFNKGRSAKISVDAPLKDGNTFDLEKYPYYKDCWILVGRNAKQISVVDGKKRDIECSMVEGGNIVCGVVTPLITAHGASYKLEIVQYVKDDGVKFAGAIAAPDTYLSIVEDTPTEEPAKGNGNGQASEPKTGKALALEVL